jgi:hypothetical protein
MSCPRFIFSPQENEEMAWVLEFFFSAFDYHRLEVKNHWVILKIRPLSYFHDGHRMSLQRSSNTPSKKTGYFGGVVPPPVVHRVVFMTFFVREKLGVENLYGRD